MLSLPDPYQGEEMDESTMNTPNQQNPQELAKKGMAIYQEKYQAEYEQKYLGKFVAIDTSTGEAWVADTPEEALRIAQEKNPRGFFHLIKIGSPSVFRVGYTQNSAREWFA